MFNIIGRRRWWYVLSGVILLPGIVALLTGGLHPGVDFTGGSLLQIRFEAPAPQAAIRAAALRAGYAEAVVQTSEQGDTLIRLRTISIEEHDALRAQLFAEVGPGEELEFSAIGPVVGAELTRAAIIAVVVASALILLYITWAFRHTEHPMRYGVAAVIALVHDALFVLGIFALLGHALGVQIDALFVTAVLTVIGFSVNDTIVVFDRIRENRRRQMSAAETARPAFADTVNYSVNQSLTRSINTSFTAAIVLLALLVLGGDTIRFFVLALSVGFAIGTYSSLFTASCLVVSWERTDFARLWRRLRLRST